MRVSALMDYTKIQQDIIKDTISEGKCFSLGHTHNGWIGVTLNNSGIPFMPKQMCFIDIEAVNKANKSMTRQESFFKGYYDAANMSDPIELTSELYVVPEAKKPLTIFVNKNGEKIYVNTAYLDIFKTGVNISYKGTDYKSPVYIYSSDDLIGLILPVNVRSRG